MGFTPVVYFISMTYLRDNTPIEDNVDDDKLTPFVIQAQTTYLQEVLGATFYDHLKDGVQNNTLNSDETSLMRNYIQPMVAQYAFYLSMPFITFKATNKSISKESSENSTPVDLSELKYLRNAVLDTAEFYKRRLIVYLLNYDYLFPTYASPAAKDNMPKSAQDYFNGVYIPRYGGQYPLGAYLEPYGLTNPCNGCGGLVGGGLIHG